MPLFMYLLSIVIAHTPIIEAIIYHDTGNVLEKRKYLRICRAMDITSPSYKPLYITVNGNKTINLLNLMIHKINVFFLMQFLFI